MARKMPLPLSAAQREIMEILWQQGESTVSQMWAVLANRREIARNTVQTMLVRIEEKGWLRHRVVGRTFIYQPKHTRQTTLGQKALEMVDNLFGGSAEELVTALLEYRGLSPQETKRIRAMLHQAEKKQLGNKQSEKREKLS